MAQIVNGGFETGNTSGWTLLYNTDTPVYANVVGAAYAHSGVYGHYVGAYKNEFTYSATVGFWQDVDFTDADLLRFWYNPQSVSSFYHIVQFLKRDGSQTTETTLWTATIADKVWHQVEIDVSAYTGIRRLYYGCHARYGGTTAFFDDFELISKRSWGEVALGSANMMVI